MQCTNLKAFFKKYEGLIAHRPESEERKLTKASHSENESYPFGEKSAPGGNRIHDLALTRQMASMPSYELAQSKFKL
jgi:hypothetical protein